MSLDYIRYVDYDCDFNYIGTVFNHCKLTSSSCLDPNRYEWHIRFDNIYDYTSNPHKLTS